MKPLKGITVIDISRLLPGGFASLLLKRLGARVIKVEQPDVGDYYRALTGGKEFVDLGHFQELHEGKEFLTLNLKHPCGKKIFEKLVRRADVLIENFRPGILAKLDLSYRNLRRSHRRIILCSISGSGQKGRNRRLAGHDLNYLALSGLLSLIHDAKGKPVIPDFQITDLVAGYRAVSSILAALLGRQRTGRGEWLDISLEESGKEMACLYRATGCSSEGVINPLKKLPHYRVYKTKDQRHIAFAPLEPKFIRNFSGAIGQGVNRVRQRHGTGLAKIFSSRRMNEWERLERKFDFCLSPVFDVGEACGVSRRKKLPTMGRDNVKILRSLGFGTRQIRHWKASGVL
ncbi:MAG: CoA transferase [Deltaproteobacteria bacterium]|nr:CoA transferase [Deltaproteobacteria bacterium]MBI2500255.1 CoA transferase [Deltaproteobacteria bacterium]